MSNDPWCQECGNEAVSPLCDDCAERARAKVDSRQLQEQRDRRAEKLGYYDLKTVKDMAMSMAARAHGRPFERFLLSVIHHLSYSNQSEAL